MKILHIDSGPFHELVYLNVAGGTRQIVDADLLFYHAQVDRLPEGIHALVVTADLQGREKNNGPVSEARLLGLRVAEELEALADLEMIPALKNVGVILAGDLYSRENLQRRGGSGDVRGVWSAFADRCRWVAGVAGNHDVFGSTPSIPDFQEFCRQPKTHFLDGEIVELDEIKIGGLSGVVGNPRKPFRRSEFDYCREIHELLKLELDMLVLHDGPDGPTAGARGNPVVRQVIESARPTLVIRGHCHWDIPLVTLANGTQVLNVDSRVVILEAVADQQ